ncbi:MAG: MBL fold metallo-hydrolase [Candidatus Hodarchaeota archaeon]
MYDFIKPLSEEFKNIYFVNGDRNGNYPFSHSLLIGDHLIDTGISANYLIKVQKQFPINFVLLSHWHEDHISGNGLLEKSKFLCHIKDKNPIENVDLIIPYYNVENTVAANEFQTILDFYRLKNVKIHKTIEDEEIINIGDDLRLKTIFTPGHTAGHCGFYEMNSRIAFFGDMDLTRFPYYATIDSNLMDFERSIEKLKRIDIEVAILGHRDPIFGRSNIKQELDNFQSVIYKRDERILASLSESKSTRLIDLKGKNLIYRRYTFKNFEVLSEMVMIEKHFDKFVSQNIIEQKEDGFVLS